jgi:hypothetical protein
MTDKNDRGHVIFKRRRGTRPVNNEGSQTAPAFYLDVFVQPLETNDADPAVPDSLLEAIRNEIIEDVGAFGGSSDPVAYTLSRVRRNC